MNKCKNTVLIISLLVGNLFSSIAWSSSVSLDEISSVARLIYDREPHIQATSDVKLLSNNQTLSYRVSQEELDSDLWVIVVVEEANEQASGKGNNLVTNVDNMNFHREKDGSVVFKISKSLTDEQGKTNWLRAPEGSFFLIKYVYL